MNQGKYSYGCDDSYGKVIGTNGIKSKADLARYLGISRARVTQVFKRLKAIEQQVSQPKYNSSIPIQKDKLIP